MTKVGVSATPVPGGSVGIIVASALGEVVEAGIPSGVGFGVGIVDGVTVTPTEGVDVCVELGATVSGEAVVLFG